jgi:hypothetical protein
MKIKYSTILPHSFSEQSGSLESNRGLMRLQITSYLGLVLGKLNISHNDIILGLGLGLGL